MTRSAMGQDCALLAFTGREPHWIVLIRIKDWRLAA